MITSSCAFLSENLVFPEIDLFFLVMFSCSGEKLLEASWSKCVEVKGKVRLEAFEKFVQELPRSRNRALMVSILIFHLSSCWHVLPSCIVDLEIEALKYIAAGERHKNSTSW